MRRLPPLQTQQHGVTMIELLVVVTIVGIFSAMAAPSFSSLLTSTRLSSQANDIVADVRTARGEAAARGLWIGICPSRDGGITCSTSASDWASGRIIFADSARTGAPANAAAVIKASGALSGRTTLGVTGLTDVNLTFSPYGGLLQAGVAGGSGTFKLCAPNTTAGKQVKVDTGGRPIAGAASCP
jgi:type IV fimbrial biogenesis protein FimT